MLLILVSIWIFKKFKELANFKGYADEAKKWAWSAIGLYVGIGMGFQLLTGVLIGAGVLNIDVDSTGVSLVIGIICWGIGGLASYVLYQRYQQRPNKTPDVHEFGEEEEL